MRPKTSIFERVANALCTTIRIDRQTDRSSEIYTCSAQGLAFLSCRLVAGVTQWEGLRRSSSDTFMFAVRS